MKEQQNVVQTGDRVEVFVPRGRTGEDPNLFVGVNGVNYLLPKGARSWVPAAVAAELDRAARAQERFENRVESLRSE